MIPYGKQSINKGDIDAVVDVLKSDFLTQGPVVTSFEKAFSNRVQSEYALACNSATSALHLACLSLGIGPEDEVWTSPISFVASANCVLYCGAKVDFVDVDIATGNFSAKAFKEKIQECIVNHKTLPKAIIPVHMAGNSCDMKSISSIAQEFNIRIIEDASHAVGGTYQGAPVGNCRYSDVCIFSFHPVKIITTGEGGMAVTNQPELYESMMQLRSHGITKDPAEMGQNDGAWYYEQQQLGFNYRMTDLQAALGLSQLERLDDFIQQRSDIASNYLRELEDLPINLPKETGAATSSWHLFQIRTNSEYDRKFVFNELRKKGVGVHVHYIPIYKQPYYQQLGFNKEYCVNAEVFYGSVLSIPIFHGMDLDQQRSVISSLKEVLL